MTVLQEYHRPTDLPQALNLLARHDIPTAALAGGIHLNAHRPQDVQAVVDLQALGLEGIQFRGNRVHVGAMTRLQSLVENANLPALVRACARRAGPNTFRNQGALGGVVVGAASDSELLAALLVHEAIVSIHSLGGRRQLDLAEFLADVSGNLGNGLLTEISFVADGIGACERVARTPADTPIVAVVGRRPAAGQLRFAFCGVAATPVLLNPTDLAKLAPPTDFRGSSEYRRHMARVLYQRVADQLSSAQGA